MPTLARKELLKRMNRRSLKSRLIVTPILDPDEQINDTAIDVRLGNQFILTQKTAFRGLDPGDKEQIVKDIEKYQTRIIVKFHEPLILHPQQLVLGSTLEYISLPNDLSCYVIGRSSWGRLGLIIATATFVNPGYKGCLTLEMENIGEVPIILYPGVRIAQLILHTVEGKSKYTGKYKCAVGPEFSRIYDDPEMDFWTSKSTKNQNQS